MPLRMLKGLETEVRILCNISGCVIGRGMSQNAESDISTSREGEEMGVIFF